ncbi:DNA primase [Streptococcus pneumoniae]|uniref:PBECR4 domain-containing protein n=1 Tax=Streptococcus pneumoniae TaxID=1313 RepID=UPI0005E9E8CB|nr:PBECR4 domain-containing protein [Streptococcus pneumoniae]CJB05144.1 DNA primase [Streptococcus pneumoniae]CJN41885.1 DNA primase [Streptococcus pneumoniae]CKA74348.1 DNA primase [Streptococcus pneumoniae]
MALSKEEAKRLSIISIAEQLGIELKRTGSYSYTWTEHDSFVIDARKNEFHWNSRTEFGDVIQLVQSIKGVSYKEAMHFLETGEFKQVNSEDQMAPKEPFHYNLERYENKDFSASRSYLKAQRGLSDDTINFFIRQGSMAEATRKKGDYFEPVIVFKYKDNKGFLAGASLQGIVENRVHYPERGRLKQIMRNSDGQLGFSIDIGIPRRLVFAEAPIDLMSYYELHKDRLQDVRLVAMDGIKDGIISRRFMELYAEMNGKSYQVDQNAGKALETVARTTNYFKDGQNQDMITLAVDNDAAGQNFITRLQEKGIPVQIAIPPIVQLNQEKEDWNDFLKRGNEAPKELVHVYTADEKSWHYQGFFEKEIALAKAQELTADDVKSFVSDVQLTKEEVRQKYQTIIHQERGRENTMSESYDNGTKYEAEDVPSSSKKDDGFVIQPETQDIIDSGEVKQWAEHPNIYFVKGLRRVALELTEEGKFEQSSQYLPKTEEEKEVVNKLLYKQKKQDEVVLEDDQSSELNIDTSHLSPEDAEWLKKNWNNIGFSVQSTRLVETTTASEEKEKPLDNNQETNTGGELLNRNSSSLGVETPGTAPQPVEKNSQPDFPANVHFHFTIDEDRMSNKTFRKNMRALNLYANAMRDSAQWYLKEMSGTSIHYVYKNPEEKQFQILNVKFDKKNWMHLTGVTPVYNEWVEHLSESFVEDVAAGKGHFKDLKFANGMSDKLKVLNLLPEVIESDSFVFNDLSSVKKFNNLDLSKAIRPEDTDLLLLFKEKEFTHVPASLMRVKGDLSKQLEDIDTGTILGVYRERDGHIEQLSINEDYIKDGGKELQSIMKNGLFEEIQPNQTDKNNYMIRLQWAEKHKDGPILPFSEIGLVDYQSFATELYKQNNIYYDKHHASVSDRMKQVEGASYTPITKVQFALYSPDGELIQDSIRYNIGEEINPIAHRERLGTREMREHPELMKIDGTLFNQYHLERLASELDISQFSYALEDIPYANQLLSQVPYGVLENSPIGFSDSSHDSRLGFISFDGMDSVEVENLSAWFEKLGVRDSPQEQVALVEKWQKEVNDLSEKVEQTIANVREEFEKLQVKDSQETLDNRYEKIYQYNRKDDRDRDLDGDGISNSDEMLQGTDPYNAASNLHQKQEDRERRTDAEAETGEIITDAIVAKSSEQTISQLVVNKDTKALAEHLKEGMKNYLDSEQFRSFLDTMSKFHNYSLNNIHLLKMQNPNVSQVASFNKWKTDFDRTVKKGSKALKIWVPYQVKTKISANQNELSFSPSENEMEEKEVTVTRFKLGNVFDVSQTEGKELPKAINELTGSVKDYEDLYRAAKAVSMDNQVSINFEEIKREGANGYYDPNENRIVISKGLKGQEHILKTIFHEMAHSDLHRGTNAQYGDDQYRKQELQAESVAYVVANHFGFDTSSYSFGYLAIWAKDKNGFEDMVEQLQIVQKEAKSLIDRMDAKLELVKNKTVTKDKFADKLQQAKEKSEQLGNQKAEVVKQVEEKKSLSSPR